MIETANKTIDGKSYGCTQFPARRGLVMQARLLKMIGPLLFGVLGSGRSVRNLMDSEVDVASVLAGVAGLQPEEFAALAFDLLAGVRLNEQEITAGEFDLTFAGDYGHLFRVLAFVVEHNFASLFPQGGIGGLTVGGRKTAAQSPVSSATN